MGLEHGKRILLGAGVGTTGGNNKLDLKIAYGYPHDRFPPKDAVSGYAKIISQLPQHCQRWLSLSSLAARIRYRRASHKCQRKFKNAGYVQLLIHPSQRKLALRPCGERDVNSIRWRTSAERPISSKVLRCQYFSAALFRIMDWSPEYQYRIRGTWASSGEDEIIIFDAANAVPAVTVPGDRSDANSRRPRRIDLLPEEWDSAFGEEFYAYSIQHGFYYLDESWNARIKSRLVPGCAKVFPATEEELQMSIERIGRKAGAANAE